MKSIYWRPQKVSRSGLLSVLGLAVVGLLLVHYLPVKSSTALVNRRWDAVHVAQAMFDAIKQEGAVRGIQSSQRLDPNGSCLVGPHQTKVTSRLGDLKSKQTSVNPNYAAAVVQMLWDAEVRPGDTVAIGWSGSYPAWNIAVAAAVDALDLNSVIVASAASSQFGANHPDFMWLDMETVLRERGLTDCQSMAVSFGAGGDRGKGLPDSGKLVLQELASRNSIPLLETTSVRDSVDQRLELYRNHANGQPIRAYINVGGGIASTGGDAVDERFQPGLNRAAKAESVENTGKSIDCVMLRMAESGVPVVHMRHAKRLAKQWELPIAHSGPIVLGEGKAFHSETPNRWLALAIILMILGSLQFIVLQPGGNWLWNRIVARWLPAGKRSADVEVTGCEPQLMV